jgi:hypothetical protein
MPLLNSVPNYHSSRLRNQDSLEAIIFLMHQSALKCRPRTGVAVRHSTFTSSTTKPLVSSRFPQSSRISAQTTQRRLVIRSDANFGNLFGKKPDPNKEDAARKALLDAFKGKEDPFKSMEQRKKKSSGGGGDGGGGDGGSGNNFDFNEWGDRFKGGLFSFLKTIGTIIAFIAFISAFYLWKPVLKFTIWAMRTALRLDAIPTAQEASPLTANLSKKEGLGDIETSIIGKYGNKGIDIEDTVEDSDDDDDDSDSDSDDDDDDDEYSDIEEIDDDDE